MFGVLNLNKPDGVTSRHSVNAVQRLVKPNKVGHAGTLDPMATGVLLVCVGGATRLISLLQQASKTYLASFRLGERSDTDDSTGDVTVSNVTDRPSESDVVEALKAFTGTIDQVPPAYSAVKVAGRRAYKLARGGEDVSLRAKQVTVHSIRVLEYGWPVLQVEIECGSGTYIRSIARDLGEQLGCGGLMSQLERTAIGRFSVQDAIAPDELTTANVAKHLHNPVSLLGDIARYPCGPEDIDRLRHGRAVPVSAESACAGSADDALVALTSVNGEELLAMGRLNEDRTAVQPKMVFVGGTNDR